MPKGAPKGTRPPAAGKGRPKGAENKVTREVKEMVLMALDKAGGINYLVDRALDTPASFLALVGRIIPQQINATIKRNISEFTDEELAAFAGSEDSGEGTEAPSKGAIGSDRIH
jgi:hypothetical protein